MALAGTACALAVGAFAHAAPGSSKPHADLAVFINGPASVKKGEKATLDLKVVNNGPSRATKAAFSVRLSKGLKIAAIGQITTNKVGQSAHCELRLRVVPCTVTTIRPAQKLHMIVLAKALKRGERHAEAKGSSKVADQDAANDRAKLNLTVR